MFTNRGLVKHSASPQWNTLQSLDREEGRYFPTTDRKRCPRHSVTWKKHVAGQCMWCASIFVNNKRNKDVPMDMYTPLFITGHFKNTQEAGNSNRL